MIRTTPFHERTSARNETGLWEHWANALVAQRYQMSEKFEYFAIRNAAGMFDTSPLYKYRFSGPDAGRYLEGLLARDPRKCAVGKAQYTLWCDDRGFVIEDGVLLHLADDEYLLTAAEPNLAYFHGLAGRLDVAIEDVTDNWGILSVQGPRSREILAGVTDAAATLGYFEVTRTTLAGVPVILSRTGYTGDLGFEIWAPAADALRVWDAVAEAGSDKALIPFGMTALYMARIEAGLVLLDVDFHSSRYAWTDADRSTPIELGLGWTIRELTAETAASSPNGSSPNGKGSNGKGSNGGSSNGGVGSSGSGGSNGHQRRSFVGREALERELREKTSRWQLTGLVVDWQDYDRTYDRAGLVPPKDHTPVQDEYYIYDDDLNQLGYATSQMYSPMLQRHIALARVPLDRLAPGSRVKLELPVSHRYEYVDAHVTRLPLFNPQRRTS